MYANRCGKEMRSSVYLLLDTNYIWFGFKSKQKILFGFIKINPLVFGFVWF